MTRVRVEPISFDRGRRKNYAFTHLATLPTVSVPMLYFLQEGNFCMFFILLLIAAKKSILWHQKRLVCTAIAV